jgi:hypothetical protein
VLARHADAAYRQAHMRCLNIAAWREGDQPPHMAAFDRLHDVVEFAANGQALQRETRLYLQRFLPAPLRHAEDLTAPNPAAQQAKALLSPMLRNLLQPALQPVPDSGPFRSAAWAFSSTLLQLARAQTQAMTAWGEQAAAPYRPAIIALDDPAGLAVELNGLAIQRSVEFTDDNSRKWKYETAQLIASLKQAVGDNAVAAKRQSKPAWDVGLMAAATQGTLGMSAQGRQLMDRIQQDDEAWVDDHAGTLAAQAWDSDYRDRIHAQAWHAYLGTDTQPGEYANDLDAFIAHSLAPLDQAYLGWLQSPALSRYLTHNFDPHDPRSGEAYLDVVRHLIAEAGGRSPVFHVLADMLQQDPRHPQAWLMRALALNHDPLIQAWTQAALAAESTASALHASELAEQFYDKAKEIIASALENPYANKLAQLIYQVSGPLILGLNQAIDRGAARLPTSFHLGVLGYLAKEANPDSVFVDFRSAMTRKQAVLIMARSLAAVAGGDEQRYRSAARAWIDRHAALDEAKAYPFRGIALMPADQVKALGRLDKGQRSAAVAQAATLTAEQVEEIAAHNFGCLASVDVKLGVPLFILSTVNIASAFHEMMDAKPQERADKTMNFAAGVAGIVGGAAAILGKSMENTQWGSARLAKQYRFLAIEIETRAGWLTGIGKLFGAIGGVMAGVLAIKEGGKPLGNHAGLAWISRFAGGASIIIAVIPIAVTIEAAGALVLGIAGLIVMIVLAGVAWLKPNAVQDWLEKSLYFGCGQYKFDGPAEQLQAWQALLSQQEG